MCEYCGCQQIRAIAAVTAQHDEIRAAARDCAQVARLGAQAAAVASLARLCELLEPHTAIEERALFPAMAGEFGEHTASLQGQHRRLEDALAELSRQPELDADWLRHLDRALGELFDHILREQDGLFPAALSVLTPRQWDELDEVRAESAEITARRPATTP